MSHAADTLRKARGRLALVRGAFLLAFLVLAVRAVEVATWPAPAARAPAAHPAPAPRGDIVDRNGVLLATDIPARGLYADPRLIADPTQAAVALARILGDADRAEIYRRLTAPGRFVWVRRHITPAQERAVLEIGEPGLAFLDTRRRIYPQGALAAHLLGYANVDGHGLAGAELGFEGALGAGQDVRLTLDTRLQHILEREVAAAIEEFSAKAGVGVIMEVPSGAVLAAASLPDFDPNAGRVARRDARFNRITLGVYELGSLFKIFSTAAFLEAGGRLSDRFDVREPLRRGRFTIRDYHAQDRILTTPEVFMHSSNIGAALMGQRVGGAGLKAFYEELGLLSAPGGWPMAEVGRPLVPEPWREISTLTAAYGHGIAVSPLQVAAAANVVLGDGRYRPPAITADAIEPGVAVVAPQTVAAMRQLLRLVVTQGTGKAAAVDGQRVGGKTGTAEKPSARGGYDRKRLISSFLGAFPMEAPRYLVLVVVDEPQGTKASYGYATGGWVAAPAVARIIAAMADVLAIPPAQQQQEEGSDGV